MTDIQTTKYKSNLVFRSQSLGFVFFQDLIIKTDAFRTKNWCENTKSFALLIPTPAIASDNLRFTLRIFSLNIKNLENLKRTDKKLRAKLARSSQWFACDLSKCRWMLINFCINTVIDVNENITFRPPLCHVFQKNSLCWEPILLLLADIHTSLCDSKLYDKAKPKFKISKGFTCICLFYTRNFIV